MKRPLVVLPEPELPDLLRCSALELCSIDFLLLTIKALVLVILTAALNAAWCHICLHGVVVRGGWQAGCAPVAQLMPEVPGGYCLVGQRLGVRTGGLGLPWAVPGCAPARADAARAGGAAMLLPGRAAASALGAPSWLVAIPG